MPVRFSSQLRLEVFQQVVRTVFPEGWEPIMYTQLSIVWPNERFESLMGSVLRMVLICVDMLSVVVAGELSRIWFKTTRSIGS